MLAQRICPVCNKPLPENATGRQKYCSARCRISTQRKGHTTSKCLYCGKEIIQYGVGRRQKYCDWKCRYNHLEAPNRSKQKTYTCILCGKEFISEHSFAFYCSDACRKEANRQNVARFRLKTAKEPRHKCHAEKCNIMTYNYFCHVHRRKFKTCSFMPELAGI